MWVETFCSTDLSGIALKGCMDNFTPFLTFRFTCVKGLLHNMQIPNSNRSVMKHIVHRSVYKGFSLSFV